MAIEIKLPRLGWNMEQGTFMGWLKRNGDTVQVGEALFTLEGDKAVQEIESTDSGILQIPADGPKEGDSLAVGTVLGYLLTSEEKFDPEEVIAAKLVSEWIPPTITPRAKKTAEKLGVQWSEVQGSGRNGRIREQDILSQPNAHRPREISRPVSLPTVRKVIAERMMQSVQNTAPVTLTTSIDATNLVNLRNQFKMTSASQPATMLPSFTDFIIKLTAIALKQHPVLNSRWEEDELKTISAIHIGFAVDTEAGLLVPVLHDLERLSIRELARNSKELIERARNRQLTASQMQGGTFTVTNLGSFGIDAFTPIINLPECAILGIGRIEKRAAVVGEKIEVREMMTLSLTFDHRVVDGAPAARFLQTLTQGIENPAAWLVG